METVQLEYFWISKKYLMLLTIVFHGINFICMVFVAQLWNGFLVSDRFQCVIYNVCKSDCKQLKCDVAQGTI